MKQLVDGRVCEEHVSRGATRLPHRRNDPGSFPRFLRPVASPSARLFATSLALVRPGIRPEL